MINSHKCFIYCILNFGNIDAVQHLNMKIEFSIYIVSYKCIFKLNILTEVAY